MARQAPDEQYTPRGAKIPIPEKGEFRRNLDKLLKAPPPSKATHPANPRGRPSFNPKKHGKSG